MVSDRSGLKAKSDSSKAALAAPTNAVLGCPVHGPPFPLQAPALRNRYLLPRVERKETIASTVFYLKVYERSLSPPFPSHPGARETQEYHR